MRTNNKAMLAGSGGLDTSLVPQGLQDVDRAPDAGGCTRPAVPRMLLAAGKSIRR